MSIADKLHEHCNRLIAYNRKNLCGEEIYKRRNMKFETVGKGIFGITAVVVLMEIALLGGVAYAIWHFISKFW